MEYVMNIAGHGAFSPYGRVEMTKEQVDAHNKELERIQIEGLKTHPEWIALYVEDCKGAYRLTTWMGTPVTLIGGKSCQVGERYRAGFGWYSTRRAVRAIVYGQVYVGQWCDSAMDLVRLRKARGK